MPRIMKEREMSANVVFDAMIFKRRDKIKETFRGYPVHIVVLCLKLPTVMHLYLLSKSYTEFRVSLNSATTVPTTEHFL